MDDKLFTGWFVVINNFVRTRVCVHVVYACLWCVHACDVYVRVMCTCVWCVRACDVYVSVMCTCVWCVHACGVCMRVVCACVWCVHAYGVCVRVVCACVWCVSAWMCVRTCTHAPKSQATLFSLYISCIILMPIGNENISFQGWWYHPSNILFKS